MFKWKIPTRKGVKQEKLNNDLNNKIFGNNPRKKVEKEPETNRRNTALTGQSERRPPAPDSAPHRAPSHPAPPASPASLSIPPHLPYPVTEPAARPRPPPPYVPPPSSGQLRAMTSQATQVEVTARSPDPLNTSVASSSTASCRPEAGSASWMEWTQQLQAYVAWVNSQLRKKESYRLVTDLRADLHSGVVLADLIEIISSERVVGIYRLPETAQMMRENVERILQFMAAKKIRMHHVSSKEVVEGNLKAVMRLILALAAHYKPQSVRTSPYERGVASATETGVAPTPAAEATTAFPGTLSAPSATPATSAASTSTAPTTSAAAKTGSPGTATTAATSDTPARHAPLPGGITTPNLNVPGNRKSIGHLLEGGLSVAPLRRFPSVTGQQWSTVAAGTDADADDSAETQADDEEPAAAVGRPERRGRRQWGAPGPPLYENLPRSSSFASRDSARPLHAEGIYDVPRVQPARVPEGPASLAAEPSRASQTSGGLAREIMDGFSSLPRHGARPSALDFWESMTAHSAGTSSPNTSGEFRYNTTHRMSGRRLLPKTPDSQGRGGTSGARKPADEPEERSLGSRGEVEGSSSHGSPTTSMGRSREEAVAEWLRGTPARRSDSWGRPEAGELWRHSALRRSVQLEGWAGRQLTPPPPAEPRAEPPSYDALLQELSRARRQLVALQELVSLLNGQQAQSECRGTNTANEFVFVKSRLHNSNACNLHQGDLGKDKQVELGARLSAQDRELQQLRRQLADKDKTILLQRSQFEDAIKALAASPGRPGDNGNGTTESSLSEARDSGREEMHILRDAISSLRDNFRESDPSQHTLDTLEQCLTVVLDRLAAAESGQRCEPPETPTPSRRAPITALQGHKTFTKVVYYTEKTLTPFLSSIPKRLGEITLKDFKQIFDRPGNFRFHFKSLDPEFGMVKEEISNDEEILPGFDGKLISWVAEDH